LQHPNTWGVVLESLQKALANQHQPPILLREVTRAYMRRAETGVEAHLHHRMKRLQYAH
jgi:hypothetical protein